MNKIADLMMTLDYGPSPENDDAVRGWLASHSGGFGHFIAGRFTKPGELFDVFNPAKGETIARVTQGANDRRRRRRRRRAQGAARVVGAAWRRTGASSLRARAACAETRTVSQRARIHRQRQADPRNPRHRRAAGRAAFLSSRRLGLAGDKRISGAGAGRRLRADHSVEFPAVDARLEDRARIGRGQYGGAEARRIHPADGSGLRRNLRRGGPAAGRRQHRHRRRRDGR